MIYKILLILIIVGWIFLYTTEPREIKMIPEVSAASKHYIERLYQKYNQSIYCIDGWKFVDNGASAVQFFIKDNKGNSVPARCDE